MAFVDDSKAYVTAAGGARVEDYFALLKPRVMSLVVFTAIIGLLLAPGGINPVIGVIAGTVGCFGGMSIAAGLRSGEFGAAPLTRRVLTVPDIRSRIAIWASR